MCDRKAFQNSDWQWRVRRLLKAGFGVEDIAEILKCKLETVRQEVSILREDGDLESMFRNGAK
jgi:DNA-binding NarL/FixJ family response regulator